MKKYSYISEMKYNSGWLAITAVSWTLVSTPVRTPDENPWWDGIIQAKNYVFHQT